MNINLAVMTLSITYRRSDLGPVIYSIWNLLSIIILMLIMIISSHLYLLASSRNKNRKTPQKHYIIQPAPRNIRNRQKKFDGNINKRGQVPMGKAAEHTDDPAISKGLIAFFMFVVIGSSIVQILRMFQTSVPNLSE